MNTPSLRIFAYGFAALMVLSGCGPLITQSPGEGLSPVNAVSQGEDKHLMLFGHDVVSYFTDGKPSPGKPELKSTVQGVTFWFSNSEHKAMFDADPNKYIPQYGGYCTNGIAYAIPWGGDVDTWKIVDNKLYIFGGRQSFDAFFLDQEKNMALADKYWKEEVAGSNAFFQRLKRLTFKVPHYKSGEELAADIKAARG
ncbi:MAG: YHS domain-containing (seleno)protein [Burkholderiaceae bacterium]